MSEDDGSVPVIACKLGVFDAEQRQQHRELIAALHGRVESAQELPDGFTFRFPSERAVCQDVMAFVTLERLCCPFLTFRLELPPNLGPLILSLTGPAGTREVIGQLFRRAPSA